MAIDKDSVDFILDSMTWSFSSVNSYNNCPKCFYLSYLKQPRIDKVQNAFAQWGTFGHSLFERYINGELELFELGEEYVKHFYSNVSLPFPPNKYVDLQESYFKAGKRYFEKFEGFPANWELVASEQEVRLNIKGYDFVGYIDMIAKDKNDGKYIIVDHKSKSKFASDIEQAEYARQLYLYSLYIIDTYGEPPKQLIFNMFRADKTVTIEYDELAQQEAVNWFISTIEKIKSDVKFIDKITTEFKEKGKKLSTYRKNDFFCSYLCGAREYCNRSPAYCKR